MGARGGRLEKFLLSKDLHIFGKTANLYSSAASIRVAFNAEVGIPGGEINLTKVFYPT